MEREKLTVIGQFALSLGNHPDLMHGVSIHRRFTTGFNHEIRRLERDDCDVN
jgi:hypothetical protein